ncbi:hypothetical protein OSB04_031505 [Centaurea solstitialis]|uniref:Zinc finger PHD-type domain-containing protein n=1 Tax=Centaurea solstitialis TaxID=347529 RepID=A0AA38VXN0_9ASTR|nr:hypothetical protein OSB04_031505 [Centaurea solstitialis]
MGERMRDIKHFSHEQHSLKLIENGEEVVGVSHDNDEKGEVICCFGCREPILDGLCMKCANLAPVINYHLHPLHPLMLIACRGIGWICDVCNSPVSVKVFCYACNSCNYVVCAKCGIAIALEHEAAIALKQEASVKFKHEGHPQHSLTLQLRSASFLCDACLAEDKDFFYQCDSCDFWMHKTCASLAHTIDLPHHPNHPLVLVYSLPDNFYKFSFNCEICTKHIQIKGWLYHCANCRYFAHIKCALNAKQHPIPSDLVGTSHVEEHVNEFMHFPLSDSFTDPLQLLHLEKVSIDDDGATEISHWSHDHPLILNVEPQGNNMHNISCGDLVEVCYGCVRPLSFPYYNCKHGCSFNLHKYCVELPRTLEHQLHVKHSLDLVASEFYKCDGCFSLGNTFAYKCETCMFYLDVNCGFLPNTIIHKSHKHPLSQVIDPNILCKACERTFGGTSFACKACNFHLGIHCAIRSPRFLTHRYCKGHEIPLTYPPVEDHPEDFYCDTCEMEMHPKLPLYHCHKCKNSFHLGCINEIDYYANVKVEGTRTISYHKHPLTFVRRKKTSLYVCFGCNLDINGRLMLECRTGTCPYRKTKYVCFGNNFDINGNLIVKCRTGTCYFRICIPCHLKKTK